MSIVLYMVTVGIINKIFVEIFKEDFVQGKDVRLYIQKRKKVVTVKINAQIIKISKILLFLISPIIFVFNNKIFLFFILFYFFNFLFQIEIEFGYYKILIDKPDYLSRGNSILVEIFELNGVHCLHAHVYAFWDYDVKCFVEVNTLIELTDRMKYLMIFIF